MPTAKEELAEALALQAEHIIEEVSDMIVMVHREPVKTMPTTNEAMLKAVGVVVVADLAAIGIWTGAKWLWDQYQKDQKTKKKDKSD